MKTVSRYLFVKTLGLIATAAAVLALGACMSDSEKERNTNQVRSSLYDPMQDAAPGDGLPSAPSISGVTPEQAQGNNGASVIYPGNGTAATSLGALNGGRR